MNKKIVIPAALQVCLDDVGWWRGKDDRAIGGPSRTGFLRDHCAADYRAIHAFGEAIGQKIYWHCDLEGNAVRCHPSSLPKIYNP